MKRMLFKVSKPLNLNFNNFLFFFQFFSFPLIRKKLVQISFVNLIQTSFPFDYYM